MRALTAALSVSLLSTLAATTGSAGCGVRALEPFALTKLTEDVAGGGDGAIAPDGREFVISSHRSGNWDLWTYQRDTHSWSQLTDHPADDLEAQWSPDGTRLAFTSTRSGNKDIWVVSRRSRALTQLTFSVDDDEYPAWSPDGRSIVYTGGPWKHRDYFVVPSEGGTPRNVTQHPGQAGACSFVPNGRSLICHGYDRGVGTVDLISLDNGERSPFTTGPGWDYKPTMQPGGGWVAFSRSDEGPSSVWLQPIDGGSPLPLTLTESDDRWPTWTASGDAVFFHRLVDRGTSVSLYDRATEQITLVVGSDERPEAASFDPTGDRVVYASRIQGREVLRIRAISGGGPQTLETGPSDAAFPKWSPDGTQIAFLSREGNRWRLSVVPTAGGGVRRLTAAMDLRGVYGPVDWSPDGRRIAFHASTAPFESDILTVDLQTHAVTPVTQDSWFDEAPSWTPDGRGLLFMSTRGGNWTWGLFRRADDGVIEPIVAPDDVEKNFPRMNRDGAVVWSSFDSQGIERLVERSRSGETRQLPTGCGHARWPSYSADGRRILFTKRDRHVEYWVAEHLSGGGSPLTQVVPRRGVSVPLAAVAEARDEVSVSPHQVYHR